MNEKLFFESVSYGYWPPREKEKTLEELQAEICEITEKQTYISNCGLSKEVTSLAIKELQEQKARLKKLMHKKVDEL